MGERYDGDRRPQPAPPVQPSISFPNSRTRAPASRAPSRLRMARRHTSDGITK